MKILSRKEQDEILKRIATCQIICNNYIGVKTRDEIDAGTKMTENLALDTKEKYIILGRSIT